MIINILFAIPLVAALSVTQPVAQRETHKDGANDVEITTWDYVDENGCHRHSDTARYTHLGTLVKNTRSVSSSCGSHTFTFYSTTVAKANGRSHKDERSTDSDPASCSSLTRVESGDYIRTKEVAGQRTITTVVDGVARPPQRTEIKNGKWVAVRGASPARSAGSIACAVTPKAGEDGGYGGNGAMLPPYAGSGSAIAVHVTPGEGGAQGVLVLTGDAQNNKQYHRRKPNAAGTVLIDVTAGTALVELVRRMDEHGAPDILSRATVGNPQHIAGTDVVARPVTSGPRILESTSSAQPGDILTIHIAGNDPQSTRFLLDGREITTLGASNNSAVVQVPPNTTLAPHALVLESANKKSPALQVAIVKLTPEPVAPSEPGVVQTVRVHVEGLAPQTQATMFFEVGGAATMAGGGTTARVPVTNGLAGVQIRGTHSGQALLRFRLSVKSAQFVSD